MNHAVLNFAKDAHGDQLRKYTNDHYILHPIAVAEMVKDAGGDENMVNAALLHDVLEDTKITDDDLANIGLSYSLRKTLVDLTKKKDEDYFTYIERVSKNSLASFVKQQDLLDNMKTERLSDLTEKDLKRLQKYHKAYLFLKNRILISFKD